MLFGNRNIYNFWFFEILWRKFKRMSKKFQTFKNFMRENNQDIHFYPMCARIGYWFFFLLMHHTLNFVEKDMTYFIKSKKFMINILKTRCLSITFFFLNQNCNNKLLTIYNQGLPKNFLHIQVYSIQNFMQSNSIPHKNMVKNKDLQKLLKS